MLKIFANQKLALKLQILRKINRLQFILALYILFSISNAASASVNWNSDQAEVQYSFHRSELITDFAITASLLLTKELIPLNQDSQRLFPDEVNSLDKSIRDELHTKSDNFLDGTIGSLYTTFAGGIAITALNLAEDVPFKKTGSELLIFANGALANKFLTKSFKLAFSRRRPLLEYADPADRAELAKDKSNHESFYSGHASTAFYSAAFLHHRISQSLTLRGHTGVRSGYQWLTGITLYSCSAYVAYSRIQIDKHYFTDVVMGSFMGLLFEEVYYRINQGHWNFHNNWRLTPQVTSKSLQLCFEKSFS